MPGWSGKLAVIAALVGGVTLGAAQGPAPPQVVRVAAASDLRFVLDDIARDLAARRPAIVLQPTYGSSGSLHAQLRQRAPYDVFLSADVAYPQDLVARGVAASGDLFTYAIGRLTVWVPNGSRLPIERDGLRALGAATRVAIANPAHAPYGQAARGALQRAGMWEQLQPRLVLGENIAQTAQFVESGAADAGLIARSLAVAPAMRDRGRGWDVPETLHAPLVQGGVILRTARGRAGAVALRDYLVGDAGRQRLERSGFGLPPR